MRKLYLLKIFKYLITIAFQSVLPFVALTHTHNVSAYLIQLIRNDKLVTDRAHVPLANGLERWWLPHTRVSVETALSCMPNFDRYHSYDSTISRPVPL